MANRFWVGGSGTWDASSTTHWSASSGGASGASVPTSADNVFVDANSGSSPVITIGATANCLDLDFTGSITATLAGSSPISIFGSMTFVSGLTASHNTLKTFAATSTGKTITTAGVVINGNVNFSGLGGGWTLQDNLTIVNADLIITQGSLDTNGKTVSTNAMRSTGTLTKSATLGASIINLKTDWNFSENVGTSLSAGTSTINLTTNNNRAFSGGGFTYSTVNFTTDNALVSGNNTIATLSITAGKILRLIAGSTQTITNLIANGTPTSGITIKSGTAASVATISKASGSCNVRHCTIQDITATGGATFNDIAGTNVSGNTGINFVSQLLIGQIKISGSVESLYWTDANGVLQKISG